jgi:hypothetical protein
MENMQSIIVYRNPMEVAIWESIMNGDIQFVPLFTAGFVFIAVMMALSKVMEAKFGFRQPKWAVPLMWSVGILSAILTVFLMWE